MTGKISEDADKVVDGTEKVAAAAAGTNYGILVSSIATYLASLAQTLTNKAINATNNTITNLTTTMFAPNVVDTDGALAANSDTRLPSQKAVKTYADALIAANDAMVFKGAIDCSANPNYPAADRGNTYRVSVSGKIGGASGINVEVGDVAICLTDGTASGNQATVGASWTVVQTNLDGAVIGPASATSGGFARFSGTTGKLLQDHAATIDLTSEVAVTFASASGATLKNAAGTSFGSGSYSYDYLVIGKLVIMFGRATVTTLSPNSSSDQVAIPLPVNSASNGSFTCRNTANGRIADGRVLATSPIALIYDSVGLSNGAFFDFTIIYKSV